LFSVSKGSNLSLWTFSLPDKKAAAFGDVQARFLIAATFSPNGRWVAYSPGSSPSDRSVPALVSRRQRVIFPFFAGTASSRARHAGAELRVWQSSTSASRSRPAFYSYSVS
jgi:hypothetical protein